MAELVSLEDGSRPTEMECFRVIKYLTKLPNMYHAQTGKEREGEGRRGENGANRNDTPALLGIDLKKSDVTKKGRHDTRRAQTVRLCIEYSS